MAQAECGGRGVQASSGEWGTCPAIQRPYYVCVAGVPPLLAFVFIFVTNWLRQVTNSPVPGRILLFDISYAYSQPMNTYSG